MKSNSFLREFCELLVDRHTIDGLKDVTIVIPSQRVALYVREYLLNLSDKTFWMPKVLPINQFLEELHDFVVIDELELVFELYEAYSEVFEEPESLDDFLSWSSMIVSDFNDIDKYLLDPNQVFRNLQSIKDIESWSFNSEELSETQKNFIKFWEKLGALYNVFQERLKEKGEATNSQVYRSIAENQIQYLSSINDYVYFIGFNALSKAEESIIKYVVNSGKGEVYWDADNYYLSDAIMEAGRFIRKHVPWSNDNTVITKDNLKEYPKEVEVIQANSNLQQVEVASSLLGDLKENDFDSTAVVFADESLLKPMLNILPDNVEKLNVAMGYPLNAASVFSFFEDIIQVQLNIERYRNNGFVYYKDFLQIIQHESFQVYAQNNDIDLSSVHRKIVKENYSFLPVELIEKAISGNRELSFLFSQAAEVGEFINNLNQLFRKIYDLLGDNVLEQGALDALINSLEKVAVTQEKYGRINKISTLSHLVKQLLRGVKVSFLGEPLEGVQFLGLLETRALDFDRVILLSCNEDVLPKRTFSNSLIPFDLRMYLGLPTKDDEEAIFAYYFYRLLQRSQNVNLIYNGGESSGLRSNEISRYLIQLEEELKGGEFKMSHSVVENSLGKAKLSENALGSMNRPMMDKRILEWLENGVSASGINQFNTCPKNFLFTQLLRLSQDEDVEEDIEASTYGTIVHEVLENLYKEVKGLVTKEKVDDMLNGYQELLRKSFDQRFPSGNYKTGKNLLMYETAVHTIKKYLNQEKELIKRHGAIKILGLEQKFEKIVPLKTSRGKVDVKIKGLIDRVDQVGDHVRIIDYKTGKVSRLKFNEEWDKMNSYEIQLLVYLYLFDTESELTCGIVSFKQLSQGFQKIVYKGESEFSPEYFNPDFRPLFEEYLLEFVERVFASEFEHDSNSKYCTMC